MSVKVQAVRGQSESMLMIESGPKVFDKALLQGMMRSKTESGDIEMASIEEDQKDQDTRRIKDDEMLSSNNISPKLELQHNSKLQHYKTLVNRRAGFGMKQPSMDSTALLNSEAQLREDQLILSPKVELPMMEADFSMNQQQQNGSSLLRNIPMPRVESMASAALSQLYKSEPTGYRNDLTKLNNAKTTSSRTRESE